MKVDIRTYFHDDTSTFTHLLIDTATSYAAVIDPVLGFDQKSGRTDTEFLDEVLGDIQRLQLTLLYIMETHAHADHLTGAMYLREKTSAEIVIGSAITEVQSIFKRVFNEGEALATDGSQFDRLLRSGDTLVLGESEIGIIATPGHTPACVSYTVNDSDVFVGDTLFPPDVGTARCDFPGGDAGTLFDSTRTLLALRDDVVLHLCHDYPPEPRDIISCVTVKQQRAENIHVHDGISRESFIEMRNQRDSGLEMPRLILPSLQVNIRAGAFPEAEANGVSYLKIPLNAL
ncbi:MBL fold metallo-hydrolase [Thalassolituus oleivorans]|uniref:MBL fold metallo-hydrolase n=1 Tax=Thalassolituus oleivorans TaxID=187493 RepID=UPI001CE39C51|nr:MBL fold metallo-hydrolase [Thalassolituus oleivorans]MCA6128842.1 beta-lactamase [Thalassolituus oleivorans 4BN06-13]